MLADRSAGKYRCTRNEMRDLDMTAELAQFFVGDPRPLEVDYSSASIAEKLPIEEQEWLAEGAFRVVVPLVGSEAKLLGLIGLGQRKSELPYSRDDLTLLGAIASPAVLALEHRILRDPETASPLGASAEAGAARFCSDCKGVYPSDSVVCPACGIDLTEAPVPYTLLGKFRFETLLGAGGMGVVYKCLDLTLRRVVAIKTLPRTSPESAMRLRQEARYIASVTHPNLATIFGAETWRGRPMLIFEYLPGGNLMDRIRAKLMTYDEALRLGITLAEVLSVLHSKGMLHRDVKPNNIAYLDPGTPKLLDFGLAQMMADQIRPTTAAALTDNGTTFVSFVVHAGDQPLAGTPQYMSPELLRHNTPSPSDDLWAVCLVLYEALTGVNPKLKPTLRETLNAILDEPMPDIREYLPECPAGIASFFQDAFSSQVSLRPQRAPNLRDRLMRCAGSL
jgi:hypothetical protein